MRLTISLKAGAITIVIAAVLVAVGVYAGTFYVKRENISKATEESVARTALNLQAIAYLREGKVTNAINLLNSMNETNLVYLMHYDDVRSTDPEFVRRKNKVLAALGREWANHSRNREASSFQSGPEWEQYQRDVDRYLKQYQE